MLDVCFSDSMKGSLHYAQHCGNSSGRAASVGVIGAGKISWWQRLKALKRARAEMRELEKLAVPLGGSWEDVVGLSFDLSYGDIAAPLDAEDCPRRDIIFQWLTDDPWREPADMWDEAEKSWRDSMSDLDRLKTCASAGEDVRIWADATPSAACGLLFTANLLEGVPCRITVVLPPKQYKRPDGIIKEYDWWGDVDAELFGAFADDAVVLSDECRVSLSDRWRKLRNENAPLRVIEDKTVMSAGEDYYDGIIRQEYPEDTCKVAKLIGSVIVKHRLGINDRLIAQRIRVLISKGELQVIGKEPERLYETMIARTK